MLPFQVVRQLHEGAYADVFVVKTPNGERACKVAHRASEAPRPARPPFVTSGVAFATNAMGAYEPDPNEILAHERDALVRVTHAHIVPVHSFSMHPEAEGPRAYLLTHYVHSRSWRSRMGTATAPSLDEYMHLAGTVATLHEQHGWFHGDLKPDNVLGEGADTGDYVMIDPSSGLYEFGGTWQQRGVRRAFTTPAYNPFVVASDVPSLANMLCELVCGAPLLPESDDVTAGPRRENSELALGASARAWAQHKRMLGQSALVRRFMRMRLPRELYAEVPTALEDVMLKANGFAIVDNKLEATQPMTTPRVWLTELERALGPRA